MGSCLYLAGRAYSTIGGIQTLNRQILQLMQRTQRLKAVIIRFDEASDLPGEMKEVCFVAGGSIFAFLKAALRQLSWASKTLWLCDHLNYGPLALLCSRGNYAIYTHAYELTLPVSWIRRLALRKARRVICISDYCAQLVCKLGVPRERIVLIPHGADFKMRPKAKSGNPKILFVGRLDRHYKGQDHLLEAAALLQARGLSFQVRFAGGGKKLEHFRAEARRLGVEKCVEFLGFVSDEELDQEFAEATIFAMPSNGEGFGLVYLQAMASGLPCICADGDAAKEVVLHEKTGLVVPYSYPEALAVALQRLIENPELVQKYGSAGRQRYLDSYTEAAFEGRFVAFLDEMEKSYL